MGTHRRRRKGARLKREQSVDEATGRRGTIIKLFGAILMMLGVLDSLLTLRGGVPAYEFLMLIAFGAAVFGIGAVRGAHGR